MDLKKILLISLIAVAIIASASAVSAGLFDGLFGGEEPQDNVIEIENIRFNTTNVTKFELYNQTEDEDGSFKCYVDENHSGYNVHIFNYSYADDPTWNLVLDNIKSEYANSSSQTVNGIVVYTTSSNVGDNVGQPRYVSIIENQDIKMAVGVISPDADETAKMASTLKFI